MKTYHRFSFPVHIILIVLLPLAGFLAAQASDQDLIKDFRWRNIGPANMQGRISDIKALDNDFTHVLLAGASGGVWKSDNAGTTWDPIFDDYGSASIGDVVLERIALDEASEAGMSFFNWGVATGLFIYL